MHWNHIFHFSCHRKSVCLIFPSFLLSVTCGYAQPPDIPVFLLSAVLLLWLKPVKWKWGLARSLSLSASLSFQTSKRGYASNVFLRSWSAAKSYKWSREGAECRGRRGAARWKDESSGGWKMNERKRQRERWGQSIGLIQEHLGFFPPSYYSRAQHNPSCFCWATTPSFWLRISWYDGVLIRG